MLSCTEALQDAYRLALQALPPDTHGRLANALTLVERGQVVESGTHGWEVASQSTPGQVYQINGTGCPCDWAHFHPGNRCTHMLAVLLQRKTLALLAQPDPAPEPAATVAATVAPVVESPAVPAVPLGEAPPVSIVISCWKAARCN
jgi:hypothetical protein